MKKFGNKLTYFMRIEVIFLEIGIFSAQLQRGRIVPQRKHVHDLRIIFKDKFSMKMFGKPTYFIRFFFKKLCIL